MRTRQVVDNVTAPRPSATLERRQLRPQPRQVEQVTALGREERETREVHR
jgi:hypothetical protein